MAGCLGGADDSAYDPYLRVGASAGDLLSSERFRSLVVEVQAVEGQEPSTETLAALQEFLEDRLDKPDGIRVEISPSLPRSGAARVYTSEDIRDIDRASRKRFSDGSRLAAYLLFVDGKAAQDGPGFNTLGQAYWNTSMVVFESTLRRVAAQIGGTTRGLPTVETVTALHEFGHVLGLVNNGIAPRAAHEDAEHRAHCTNPDCLMHHAVENGALAESMMTGVLPGLDGPCLADLRARGGR